MIRSRQILGGAFAGASAVLVVAVVRFMLVNDNLTSTQILKEMIVQIILANLFAIISLKLLRRAW